MIDRPVRRVRDRIRGEGVAAGVKVGVKVVVVEGAMICRKIKHRYRPIQARRSACS